MEIKTDDLFDSEFDKCVDYALLEFGRKTAKKWIDSLIDIKHQLRLMPERYSFVPELQKWRKYRGAIIMENFKIIYFYNEEYHIDESKIAGDKVCEPSPVYASVASESVSHHVIDSGIEQKDEIPVLKNHFSYEGLLDSIDYCETIKDDPSKWESVDAFNERLYEEFPWLR